VRQLGRAPRAGHRADGAHRLGGGRQAQTRQLVAGEAREVGDVGRVIGRKAERPHLVGEAEPAEVLHRPRLRGVGLRVERRSRFRVDEQAAHATTAELDRQHQAARPAAGDQDVGRGGGVAAHPLLGSASR
jgi:hypothetical protein